MSATKDVADYLANMKPKKGQTLEQFARSGLAWQAEIYSANAGGDIQGLGWFEISQESRESWLKWAEKKFVEAGLAVKK